MRVYRCVCDDVTFAELKVLAEAKKIRTIQNLQQDRPFGRSCGLCLPYVRRMLQDGSTEFDGQLPLTE